ncbi:MAG TPA: TAXI family TRAP transporter solute-binding subunit [Candidatus Limnocylindrales bacterium]|nr:TAXI family TRAP transporter solute-binding subunit [Candidatus Limnocylindrales bacterium]
MSGSSLHSPRRTRAAWSLLVALILTLTACAPIDEGEDGADQTAAAGASGTNGGAPAGGELTIATGGTGGVYYPLGGGLADVIGDNVEGYSASVQETNASVDNMLLIGDGGADIAFTLGDTAADAVNGEGEDFAEGPIEACALARIYDNFTQIVASSDSGVTSVEEMRDKRISLGSPGSGTEVIALRILAAAGIDPDADIERQQLGVDETVAALRDGTIDAGFWSGGLPTSALVDYATTGQMVLVPHAEYTEDMVAEYGDVYVEDVIPADTYEGQAEDVEVIVVPNVLVVNTSMDEQLQQDLTRVLFEQKEALVGVHAAAEALDPELAQEVGFMDICPGSQTWYDEAG